MTRLPAPETFLSGEHGEVGGRRSVLLRLIDALLARQSLRGIDLLAERTPARTVLVASVYRPPANLLVDQLQSLRSSAHRVRYAFGSTGEVDSRLTSETVGTGMAGGKFENLNALLTEPADWILVVDDDVVLPARFLDRLIALAEHFGLALVQPAQSLASHAAWRVTRRVPGSLLRETRFVEIGPVTAFRRDAAEALLPFPPLRYGWGLDLAWAATALERGWRLGIADALAVRHELNPVAAGYPADAAIEEAQQFLAERPYLSSAAAQETLKVHRRLRA